MVNIDLKAFVEAMPDSAVHNIYLDIFATSDGRLNPVEDQSYTTRANSRLEISDLIFPELA